MIDEFISNFHFLRPWILILLLIPISFYFYVFKNNTNLSSWEKVCDENLLRFLLIKNKNSKRKIGVSLMYLGLVFAILSAAGPVWKKSPTETLSNQNPVMILLNLSTNMLEADVKPSRLDRAKLEIIRFLEQLKTSETGLIVYTQEPFLISPLSTDNGLVINLLDAVNTDIMPINGDRLDRAIELAVAKISAAGYNNGSIVIYTASAGMSYEKTIKEAVTAAKKGYKINIIDMALQPDTKLEQIANATGGKLLSVGYDESKLVNIILNEKENFKENKNKAVEWQDYGWYLLWIPMMCMLNFFRKGILVIFLVIGIQSVAYAGFLWNDNQLAMKDFEQKKYNQAAQKFNNQMWKASSYYKAGNYEKAAQIFADKEDIKSIYNYANAMAKSGKLDEAIKAYENVLKKDKNHKDAKFNLEYIKKQQKQNQSKNQTQNNKQDKNQKQNQSNENQNKQDKNQKQQDNQQAQQEQNKDEKNKQEAKAQQSMASAQAEEENQDKKSDDNSKENQDAQTQKIEQSVQKQKEPVAQAKTGPKNEKYDEKAQAKVQKFREIPEDKGGLLRAFIQKEYFKNRYGD